MDFKNQKGLTLIELLATITLLSIIGLIVWGVLFQGIQYSQNAMTKNQMQQEANIILEKFKHIHRISEHYTINSNENEITIMYKEKDKSQQVKEKFQNGNFQLIVEVFEMNAEGQKVFLNNVKITPGENNPEINLTIKDLKNMDNKLEVNSFLYRLGGEIDES